MRVFVDTNVLIDYLCRREPYFVSAKAIFAACFLGRIEVVASSLSIVNVLYIGRKYESAQLKESLLRLSRIADFADLQTSMVLETLQTEWTDYEDALQYTTALLAHADCIVTRNEKDFSNSSLPVYSPEEFLNKLNSLVE